MYVVDSERHDWKRFEIEVPLCDQVTHFDITIKISGKADLWVDDLKMEYDEKPYTEARQRKSKRINYAATTDKRYRNGSGFNIPWQATGDAISKHVIVAQVENLMLLCRVWGFLKYYHPAVIGGKYNWDNELFAILPDVYDLGKPELNRRLFEWVSDLSDDIMNSDELSDEVVSDTQRDISETLSWIYDRERLGGDLSSTLIGVACSKREPFCYYASPVIYAGNIKGRNENYYKKMSFEDDGMKLLAVFRLWNFAEFFHPYKELIHDWEGALRRSIVDVLKAKDDKEYSSALQNITKAMNDFHCQIMPRRTVWKLLKMRNYYKYGAQFLSEQYQDGGFWVTYSFGTGYNDLHKGDIIYAIDDVGTDDYIRALYPGISYANFNTIGSEAASMVGFTTDAKQRKFTIDRNREMMDLTVNLLPSRKVMKKGRADGVRERTHAWFDGVKLRSYEVISDSILYINAGKVTAGDLKSIFDRQEPYMNYIIDIREYPKSLNTYPS